MAPSSKKNSQNLNVDALQREEHNVIVKYHRGQKILFWLGHFCPEGAKGDLCTKCKIDF